MRQNNRVSTARAPTRSWMPAECTTTVSRLPSVSTAMCRLRPLIFLPASYPRCPLLGPSWQTANLRSPRWAWRFAHLPCAPARAAPSRRVPKHRCRANSGTAHAPSSTEESCWAIGATGSPSSPHTASRPPPAAVHACAAGLRRDARLGAPSAAVQAWPTAHPSNHSDTSAQAKATDALRISLPWFLGSVFGQVLRRY